MANYVVVGCSKGIGFEIKKYLISQGHKVLGISHSEETKDIYKCSVEDYGELEKVAKKIHQRWKTIDGIVYVSGISLAYSIPELEMSTAERMFRVNTLGYIATVKAFYPYLVEQRKGSIVEINSKSGKKGSYKNSVYAATKFADLGLTQSFALELAEFGIRVNAVCPGNVFETDTWQKHLFPQFAHNQNLTVEQVKEKYINLVPLKRSCHYEDINYLVEFLLSDKSSYITGQALNVTGGQQLGC